MRFNLIFPICKNSGTLDLLSAKTTGHMAQAEPHILLAGPLFSHPYNGKAFDVYCKELWSKHSAWHSECLIELILLEVGVTERDVGYDQLSYMHCVIQCPHLSNGDIDIL